MDKDWMDTPAVKTAMDNLRESYYDLHAAEQNLKRARKRARMIRTAEKVLVVFAIVRVTMAVKQIKRFEKEEK